jgi:hypothetical protein
MLQLSKASGLTVRLADSATAGDAALPPPVSEG